MTEEQKETLIAKMLDFPHSLSAEETYLIENDEELHELYQLSAGLKTAFPASTTIDIDKEWQEFQTRIITKPRRFYGHIVRVAAMLIGVVFLSIIGASIIRRESALQPSAIVAAVDMASSSPAVLTVAAQRPVVELHAQPEVLQTAHCVASVKPMRTDVHNEEIDVDEYLRIQQANIDNDIAADLAEMFIEQYRAIQQLDELMRMELLQSGVFVDGEALTESEYIKQVTLQ